MFKFLGTSDFTMNMFSFFAFIASPLNYDQESNMNHFKGKTHMNLTSIAVIEAAWSPELKPSSIHHTTFPWMIWLLFLMVLLWKVNCLLANAENGTWTLVRCDIDNIDLNYFPTWCCYSIWIICYIFVFENALTKATGIQLTYFAESHC